MFAPRFERLFPFVFVTMVQVVRASPRARAANMPNNLVGDFRAEPQPLQPGGNRPAKIVDAPIVELFAACPAQDVTRPKVDPTFNLLVARHWPVSSAAAWED